MAMDPSVRIDLAAEFTGKKAFGQADTATQKLTKSAKNLARTFGVAFGSAAVLGFARKSIKASLEAQAQQARLASLLKVTVGATDEQIASLDAQAAALEKVGVVSAGNITQTQSQLATFNLQLSTIKKLTPAILDYVTAEKGATATTEEFKSMTNGLAQALNGNFASLTRTGFVLDENTKSIIENGSESERVEAIIAVLNSTYKDFNKNLRDTPAGQMAVLANAAQEATTVIGTSLLGALQSITNSRDIEQLAEKVIDFGNIAGEAIEKLGVLIRDNLGLLKSLGVTFAAIWTASAVMAGISTILKLVVSVTKAYKALRATAVGAAIAQAALLNPLGAIAYGIAIVGAITAATIQINKLSNGFEKASAAADELAKPRIYGGIYADKFLKEKAAAEAKALKNKLAKEKAAAKAAALAKLKADKLAAENAKKLSKAQSIFDLDKIQIEAALKGKISEEEKIRLLLMQAILDEDAKKAENLEKKLEDIQKKNAEIAETLANIPPANDPFATWTSTLSDVASRLAAIDQIKLGAKLIEIQTRESGYTAPIPVVISTSPNIFSPTDTPSEIADKAANAAAAAAAAASAAAASVIESQAVVEALAQAATNGIPAISGTGPSSIFNPYAVTPGSSAGFGTQAPPMTLNLTVEGSILTENDFVDLVNKAVITADTYGYNQYRPGSLTLLP